MKMFARLFLFALAAIVFASGAYAQSAVTANCAVNTNDPSYTNGTVRLCSQTTTGHIRVDTTGSTPGGTQDVNVVQVTPNSGATGSITTVKSSALESNHVIKSSAGNLYGWSVTTGAVQGWVLLYNGASAPTAGGAAVAPEKCFYAPANSSLGGSFLPGPPMRFATGIVVVFSSSGCLTNTASATVFISGDAS